MFLNTLSEAKNPEVLGDLTLFRLSIGMIAFTIAMVVDIYLFGQNMRSTLPQDAFKPNGNTVRIFEPPGKIVLIFIGFLICAAWFLASLESWRNFVRWIISPL
jgi:hypothetical protein